MKPDAEALERLIASLPNPENEDLDDDPVFQKMGWEEIAYLNGLRDAFKILNGQPVRNSSMPEIIRRHMAGEQ